MAHHQKEACIREVISFYRHRHKSNQGPLKPFLCRINIGFKKLCTIFIPSSPLTVVHLFHLVPQKVQLFILQNAMMLNFNSITTIICLFKKLLCLKIDPATHSTQG